MDSTVTIIQHIVTDTLSFDSLNQKLPALKNIVIQVQQSKPANSTLRDWIPLLAAIIVGLIVIIPQHLDRKSKRNNDRRNALREIYANCRKLEELMKNNYRELAMTRTDVEYREIERRMNETKAEFIGHVRKFQAITIEPLTKETENKLEIISDLTNEKAKSNDTTFREKEMKESFYKNLNHFKDVNDDLQKLMKLNDKASWK